ncbi:MAG: cyclic nucleotide-binding domain-containing protein, partial [Magnetococcus sp. DMHC-8]
HSQLQFGALIGIQELLGNVAGTRDTYRAVSHCTVIRFSSALFKAFLENNGLLSHMGSVMDKVEFLRKTRLFAEQTTFQLIHIAQQMEMLTVPAGGRIVIGAGQQLWLVVRGGVQLTNGGEGAVVLVEPTDFFGEESYLTDEPSGWQSTATCATELYRLEQATINKIPIVLWRMLEEHDKRVKQLRMVS